MRIAIDHVDLSGPPAKHLEPRQRFNPDVRQVDGPFASGYRQFNGPLDRGRPEQHLVASFWQLQLDLRELSTAAEKRAARPHHAPQPPVASDSALPAATGKAA